MARGVNQILQNNNYNLPHPLMPPDILFPSWGICPDVDQKVI
jgi:hypothetical protein